MGNEKIEQQSEQRMLLTTSDYMKIDRQIKEQERADREIARTWLSRAFKINEQIRITEQNIEFWKTLANKTTSNPSETMTTNSTKTINFIENGERESITVTGRVEQYSMLIIDAMKRNEADLEDLANAERDIEWAISYVGDDACMELLKMRYLLCRDWEIIGAELSYSVQHTSKYLHYKALNLVLPYVKFKINEQEESKNAG